MNADPSLVRTWSIGRVAFWLVLLILVVTVVYATAIAVTNWGPIGV
jgi:hypothetical protein